MVWTVELVDEFDPEFDVLPTAVQDKILSGAQALETTGPELGRPSVDTLKGSKFANMKELRFEIKGEGQADGVWRVVFAFDTVRKAMLLVAGNKLGLRDKAEKKFYKELIKVADQRLTAHEARLKGGKHGTKRK